MKTVRRPPYPKWNPGYFPCSSLIPLPLSSRRPSVSFGGFGVSWQSLVLFISEKHFQGCKKRYLNNIVSAVRYFHRDIRDDLNHCAEARERFRNLMGNIRRNDVRQDTQAKPIGEREFGMILDSKAPAKWKALIGMMRDGMLRANEILNVRYLDVRLDEDGSGILYIAKSKTDQEGAGAEVYLSRLTVNLFWEAGMDLIRRDTDRLFPIVGRRLREIIDNVACVANLPGVYDLVKEQGVGGYSGHSCRVGMAYDLADAGYSLVAMQHAGRWKSPLMPGRYTRRMVAKTGAVARWHEEREKQGEGEGEDE